MKYNQYLVFVLSIISSLFPRISSKNCFAPVEYRKITNQNSNCDKLIDYKVSDYTDKENDINAKNIQHDCLHLNAYRDVNETQSLKATSDCKKKNRFDGTYSYKGMSLDNDTDDYLNSAKFSGSITEDKDKGGELNYLEGTTGGFIAATNAPIGDFRITAEEFKTECSFNLIHTKKCFSGNFIQQLDTSNDKNTKFEKDNTVLDFYKALKKHKIKYVVMLTNFVEKSTDEDCTCKVKADRYFPDKVREILKLSNPDYTPSKLTVETTTLQVKEYGDTTETRNLKFTDNTDNSSHEVTHYHYKKWIDFSVPKDDDLKQLFKLIAHIRKKKDAGENIIVHCTGGIGRTGTFISSVLTSNLQADKKFNLITFILKLREKRPEFVETDKQVELIIENIKQTMTPTRASNKLKMKLMKRKKL